MDSSRLDDIRAKAEAVLTAAIDLRRDTPEKVETSREQWKRLTSDANFACIPDNRDSPKLQHLIAAVRSAVRSIEVPGVYRCADHHRTSLPQWITDKRRDEFSEKISQLRSAIQSILEFAASN